MSVRQTFSSIVSHQYSSTKILLGKPYMLAYEDAYIGDYGN